MGRPRNSANTLATRQAVLDAAEAAFASQGQGARLGDISAAAGIKRPSLLYHFPSKEVLYEAVVGRTFADLGQALVIARTVQGDFPTQLRSLVMAFSRFLRERPSAARIIVQELIAVSGPGQALLMAQAGPLLDSVETWICQAGGHHLRPGVPVRRAMLQVASDVLLRHASGALGARLWGSDDDESTWVLAQATLLIPEAS